MIKLIIFDLDGVLIETKKLHFDALNYSLIECGCEPISFSDHVNIYDGLPTITKLNKLKSLNLIKDSVSISSISSLKQKYTLELLSNFNFDSKIQNETKQLKNFGYKIYVASNSIKDTVRTVLDKLGIINLVDGYFSNEDVKNPKPHPEIYFKCMIDSGLTPQQTLILEDSPHGIIGAKSSGANLMTIKSPNDINAIKIMNFANKKNPTAKTKLENFQVLIPMAGAGSRFQQAGYTFPKPLIPVNNFNGSPMIKVVADNIGVDCKFIYVVNSEHRKKYNLDSVLNLITPDCEIVEVDTITDGAACTCLLAESFIDNDRELIVANSDQFVEWNSFEFIYSMRNKNADGGILTFENSHPKWSYIKLDSINNVIEVKEKEVISNLATVGIYYWKEGRDFVKYAKRMIEKDIRYGQSFNGRGEFYVAPIYNEMISDRKIIKHHQIEKMHGLGTPEDLEYFVNNYASR